MHSRSGADSGMGLSTPSKRQRYFDLGAAAGATVDGKRGFSIGIQPSHTLPGYGQSEAAGVLQRPTGGKTGAVVEHTNVETIPVALRGHDHGSAGGSPGDAMPDGVFH